jgi:Skp family chaperone for outer membrane proteins
MPKKVSWDDKENIRFINCVGQQNKVRRHKKMSKSREDVYKQHIKELKTKMAEMVAEKKKMAEMVAEKDKKMAEMVAEKDQEINDLADKVLELNLQLASSSRKSSDAMNTSTSSTGSSMSMASVSSSPSDK